MTSRPTPAAPEAEFLPVPAGAAAADFGAAIAAFDREAEAGVWHGPRYRMAWRARGQGPPLVLIPGIAATYRVFALVLNELSAHFRTVVYDYPGDRPDDGARLAKIGHGHLVEDLLGLVAHLDLDRPVLFGTSFGSTVALAALHRDPGRFPAAAIQGGFARRPFGPLERLAILLGRRFRGTVAGLPLHDRALSWKHRRDFPTEVADRWAHYIRENGLTPIRALTHRLDLLGRIDLRPILPEIPHEVLLIQGTADRLVPRRFYDELRAGLPYARGLLVPGVGHQPHFTHAEAMARAVAEFLLPRTGGGLTNGPGAGPPR